MSPNDSCRMGCVVLGVGDFPSNHHDPCDTINQLPNLPWGMLSAGLSVGFIPRLASRMSHGAVYIQYRTACLVKMFIVAKSYCSTSRVYANSAQC